MSKAKDQRRLGKYLSTNAYCYHHPPASSPCEKRRVEFEINLTKENGLCEKMGGLIFSMGDLNLHKFTSKFTC